MKTSFGLFSGIFFAETILFIAREKTSENFLNLKSVGRQSKKRKIKLKTPCQFSFKFTLRKYICL